MLEAAGLSLIVDPPEIDERAIKVSSRAEGLDAAQTADRLAGAKAAKVQSRHQGRIVIGADQMLECGGEWFDKPVDRPAAARQIAGLAGRTHVLYSAIVAFRDGVRLWGMVGRAEMSMRPLSATFVDFYLDRAGSQALNSVGGYQIEGIGIQLFENIGGDYFTILGLPLLPLLVFLRREGAIRS
jgi:septum formation protein